MKRPFTIYLSSVSIAVLFLSGPSVHADSVHLKNGFILQGKVDETKSDKVQLVLTYGKNGLLRIGRDRVLSVEKNAKTGLPSLEPVSTPKPAATPAMVRIRLNEKAFPLGGHDSSVTLVGVPMTSPDKAYSLLQIPGVGSMRIPREAIATVEPFEPPAGRSGVAPATAASSIRTTHIVYLKNGRKIPGNVLASPENHPLTVEIGHLGKLLLPRDQIEKVEKSDGKIDLPLVVEKKKPTKASQTEPAIETTPSAGEPDRASTGVEEPAITLKLQARILKHLQELTRWRSRDRTRGEKLLGEIGAPAVPYLYDISRHPFGLTRRAVLRLVRDIGDPTGIPLALEALLDEDRFVRSLAHEALRSLLSVDLGSTANAKMRRRLETQKRWRDYYEQLLLARS